MSNALSDLVWGARPFGSSSLRLVLASLADQVNEQKHGDWCFPSLRTIQERTELKRRTVVSMLQKAKREGWLVCEARPGYGNAYIFRVERLRAAQLEGGRKCTRAFNAPVQKTARGADYGAEGCKSLLPNKEEPESNQKLLTLRVVEKPQTKKHARSKVPAIVHPLTSVVRAELERAMSRVGNPEQWGPGAAAQLKAWLERFRDQPPAYFAQCISNWEKSATKHHWPKGGFPAIVAAMHAFFGGPIDQYGNVKALSSSQQTKQPKPALEKIA